MTNEPIELQDEERTRCEVWTRVMGYHRPVSAFNAGKRAEHADRAYFSERPASTAEPSKQALRNPPRSRLIGSPRACDVAATAPRRKKHVRGRGSRKWAARMDQTMTTSQSLRVGGLTPLTSIDYPGELAAVIYCQGCPWRCRHCHNGHLLSADAELPIPWDEVKAFLDTSSRPARRGGLHRRRTHRASGAARRHGRVPRHGLQGRTAHRRPLPGTTAALAAADRLDRARHQGPARRLPADHRRTRLRRQGLAKPAPAAQRQDRVRSPHHADAGAR